MKKVLFAVALLASSSVFAAASEGLYAQVRGGYERISLDSADALGGGASIGYIISSPVAIEGYVGYTRDSAGIETVTIYHYGGKTAIFLLNDMVFVKAGAGIAHSSTSLGATNELEIVGNAGLALSVATAIAFTVEGQYTRVAADVAYNAYSAMAGLQFKF
jgi:hypothetical protein